MPGIDEGKTVVHTPCVVHTHLAGNMLLLTSLWYIVSFYIRQRSGRLQSVIACFILFGIMVSCSSDNMTSVSGGDLHFTIVSHADDGFSGFNRKVVVFGIDIYAVAAVEDAKLLHAANVMAQYLDNDEDGVVDNKTVLDNMLKNKAYLVMWSSENDLDNVDPPAGRTGQDLGNGETNPTFVSGGKTGQFDASLEEVLHLINSAGHSHAYPQAFGQHKESALARAMDIARGGQFLTIPDSYPANAWYTYTDTTCEYATCQTIEYLYWALTSMLGAQENRSSDIKQEWKLHTKALVERTDKAILALLTNPAYKMPTILPDGTYRR